jgi:hypothetical protein
MKGDRQPEKDEVPVHVEGRHTHVGVPAVPGYLARLLRPMGVKAGHQSIPIKAAKKDPAQPASRPGRDSRLVKGKRP